MKTVNVLRRVFVVLVGAIVLNLAAASRAATAPITFAQFSEVASSNANGFVYSDNGAVIGGNLSTAGTATVSIPIVFDYLSLTGLPADLTGNQSATLTLTSSSAATVQTTTIFGIPAAFQAINGGGNAPDVLTITRDTPAAEGSGSQTILLQMTFTGELGGLLSLPNPDLQGSTLIGDIVSYSSDFLTFTASASDFNVAFSSWTSTGDSGGLEVDTGDGMFNAASAAGVGTFDTTFSAITIGSGVPEPTAVALAGIGAFGLLGRRRKAC